ncbi:hypothetical protein [Halegenticoccus tardaugens]|uniref:hypothetical protein n=1 Tax=Halegenticoccus tardaugens TaxID=2071624 RepID=UPI00100AAFCB|nr:hypothetical protein [Halegenticoccus tardaugens]
MTKTNWSRCFSLLVVAVLLVAAAATPALAASVGESDVPEEGEVGEKVSATVTLDDLYNDPDLESWELAGETELEDVTWTVTYYDQTDSKTDQESFDGADFDGAAVDADDDASEVRVEVTGTVPEVENYSYDPEQTFLLMSLTQTRDGGSDDEIDAWRAHHHTSESREARLAIDAADAAVADAAGGDTADAERALRNAIDAYESGNFDLAANLAGESESKANEAKSSSRTKRLAMYGAGGFVGIVALIGGVAWWRSQRDGYDKLG